jgi:AcrR family transcriptional regulator
MNLSVDYTIVRLLSISAERSVSRNTVTGCMPGKRKYELKQRAERQEATRLRIVEAAVALHEAVGGAGATITAIAERAGVGRPTVYRHFPDERALYAACTQHYFAANPPPDPTVWTDVPDPHERLETALREVYTFFQRNEGILTRADQDVHSDPVLAEVLAPYAAYWTTIGDILLCGWDASHEPDPMRKAAIGLALAFSTWRVLTREQGLDTDRAVALMLALVRDAPWDERMEAGSIPLHVPVET